MKIIKATFKGRNGSLGYITGKEYTLKIRELIDNSLLITDQNKKTNPCEYSGSLTFFENWTNIIT